MSAGRPRSAASHPSAAPTHRCPPPSAFGPQQAAAAERVPSACAADCVETPPGPGVELEGNGAVGAIEGGERDAAQPQVSGKARPASGGRRAGSAQAGCGDKAHCGGDKPGVGATQQQQQPSQQLPRQQQVAVARGSGRVRREAGDVGGSVQLVRQGKVGCSVIVSILGGGRVRCFVLCFLFLVGIEWRGSGGGGVAPDGLEACAAHTALLCMIMRIPCK